MKEKKYFLHTNVCERRVLEEERLKIYCKRNGYTDTNDINEADLLVFFSCGMKEEESGFLVKDLRRKCSARIPLVVFGCYASMVDYLQLPNTYYIGLSSADSFDTVLKTNVKYADIELPNFIESQKTADFNFWDPRLSLPKCRDVFSVLISEGCSKRCSYCTIRNATGPLKSRSIEDIIQDFQRGLSGGFDVFRFQCENLGTFGMDTGENMGDLLKQISKITEDFCIDLPDLHPSGFVNYFDNIIELIKRKKVYLIHLPIQSGSQKILDLMNREYEVEVVLDRLKILQNRHPNVPVGTDVIVGFPGEEEEDFRKTCEFLNRFRFRWIYCHGYNDKHGSLSSRLSNKVNPGEVCRRVEEIYKRIKNVVCYLNDYQLEDS